MVNLSLVYRWFLCLVTQTCMTSRLFFVTFVAYWIADTGQFSFELKKKKNDSYLSSIAVFAEENTGAWVSCAIF